MKRNLNCFRYARVKYKLPIDQKMQWGQRKSVSKQVFFKRKWVKRAGVELFDRLCGSFAFWRFLCSSDANPNLPRGWILRLLGRLEFACDFWAVWNLMLHETQTSDVLGPLLFSAALSENYVYALHFVTSGGPRRRLSWK